MSKVAANLSENGGMFEPNSSKVEEKCCDIGAWRRVAVGLDAKHKKKRDWESSQVNLVLITYLYVTNGSRRTSI